MSFRNALYSVAVLGVLSERGGGPRSTARKSADRGKSRTGTAGVFGTFVVFESTLGCTPGSDDRTPGRFRSTSRSRRREHNRSVSRSRRSD